MPPLQTLDGSVPPNVNLAKQKPGAVQAYSRRFKSIATNAQTFTQGQFVNIVLDTSTPGSFIDPLQSYLKFDFTAINTNPFIDYFSFGPAGLHSVIQEFRIYCNGVPLEEILNYNLAYSGLQDVNGHCRQPYLMYRSCKVKQPVPKAFSVNAIKPAMVNVGGSPMWYASLQSSNPISAYASSNYATLSVKNPSAQAASASTINFGNVLVSSLAPYSNCATFSSVKDAADPTGATNVGLNPSFAAEPTNQDLLNMRLLANVSSISPFLGTSASAGYTPNSTTNVVSVDPVNDANYAGYLYSLGGLAGVSSSSDTTTPGSGLNLFSALGAINNISTTSNTTASNQSVQSYLCGNTPKFNIFGGANMVIPGTSGLSQTSDLTNVDVNPANPLNWPFCQPNDLIFNGGCDQTSHQTLQDYFMYLANCKYIPCGLKGQSRPGSSTSSSEASTNYPDATYTINSANFKNVNEYTSAGPSTRSTYTGVLPLMSGILGSMATKCFPTMLIAPGSMYIQLKLAQNKTVFQVSMDPCRRVLGTIRDFVPFMGSIGGLYGQGNYAGLNTLISNVNTNTDTTDNVLRSGISDNYLNNTSNTATYVGQGITTGPTSDGLNYSSFNYTSTNGTLIPLVPGYEPCALGLSGKVWTSQLGYSTAVQMPTLGGYNALIGSNLLPQQQMGSNLTYTSSAKTTCNYGSLIFLPYSVAAMMGYWTTTSIKESSYYSSNDKNTSVSDSNQTSGNAGLYNTPISSALGSIQNSITFSNVILPVQGVAPLFSAEETELYMTGTGNTGNFYAGCNFQSFPSTIDMNNYVDFKSSQVFPGNTCLKMTGQITMVCGSISANSFNLAPVNGWDLPSNASLGNGYLKGLQVTIYLTKVSTPSVAINIQDFSSVVNTVGTASLTSSFSYSLNGGNVPTVPFNIVVRIRGAVTAGSGAITFINGEATASQLGSFEIPGTFLAITTNTDPSIQQTTNYPYSDISPSSQEYNQNPIFPFQIGALKPTLYNATTDAATINDALLPFTPMPSVTQSVSVGNASVGQSLMTKTELVTHPSGIPLPQYMLVDTPWALKEMKANFNNSLGYYNIVGTNPITPANLVNESSACYGTYLESSQAQSLRCFNSLSSLGSKGGSNELSYQLTNVEFVGQQIILPDEVTQEILQMASEGEIAIQSTSIHVYQTGVQPGSTQNLIIPAKISSANAMYIFFQASNIQSGSDAQLYNSFSRLCPYSKVASSSSITSYTSYQATGSSGSIGSANAFTVNNVNAGSGSFEIQLKIGNELIPQQPITSISEIIAESQKCEHKLFDLHAEVNNTFALSNLGYYSSSGQSNQIDSSSTGNLYYDCLVNGSFCSAFISTNFLDDQTYISNPNLGYIATIADRVNSVPGTTTASSYWGTRYNNIVPTFIPFDCPFYIGFDLDTWAGYTDVARSGKFLGNNTIQLYMTNCIQFDNSSFSGIDNIQMYVPIIHDTKISCQAGGQAQVYF